MGVSLGLTVAATSHNYPIKANAGAASNQYSTVNSTEVVTMTPANNVRHDQSS